MIFVNSESREPEDRDSVKILESSAISFMKEIPESIKEQRGPMLDTHVLSVD